MVKGCRIQFTEQQKEILLKFYEEGMKSTKKAMSDKIRECSAKVAVSEEQVKHWINNHNSKVNGGSRMHNPKTKTERKLVRKPSGFNAFTRDFLQKEQSGGSAEVFRTIGEKWRSLPESTKDSFRKRAAVSGCVSLPSPNKKAKRIITNIMNEVARLEALGGHSVVLCAYDGTIFHGSAGAGGDILNTNLIQTFETHLRCSQEKKQDISVKSLQELFNLKYSELVQRGDSKMPYSKIDQLGITFQDLPLNLQEEIGRYPKKPHLYGSAQRRKLWTTRHDWSFCVSLSTASDPASPSASHTTTTTHISARPPTSHPSTVPVTASPSTSHASTIPVSVRPSTFHTSTIPDSVQPSTSHSPTVPVTALPSTSHTSTISVSVHPSTFSTLAQQSLSTTSGFIVSQDTQFGMLKPNTNRTVHAVCVLSSRTRIHGRTVTPGSVVVEVRKVLTPGLRPICSGAFDEGEDVYVGGFYEWPSSQLTFLKDGLDC